MNQSLNLSSLGVTGFAALLRTQQAVAAAGGDVDGVMRAVVEGALQVMPQVDGAVIEMRDGEDMVYRAASGTSAGTEGLRLKLATSLSGRCVLLGEPLSCLDSETDSRVDREACRKIGLRSMIVAPIPHRGQTVGAFKLYAKHPLAFSNEDLLAIQLLVGPIVIGLSGVAEAKAEQARVEAEAATAAKASFLANMSHEIRTPMNGIIGFGDLLMRSELSQDQKRYASMIVESGAALLKLLNDILDFSKIEAGEMDVVEEPFDLPHVLDQCGRLMAPTAEAKGLALVAEIDPALPDYVTGDGLRLRQIVLNLLGNAVKFTATGQVSLKARVSRRRSGPDALLISVADTGIGIPANRIDRIFEKFVQADASVARKFGGTGLGLSISQRLAELMGGEIELESTVGVGTTVTLRLPLKPAERPEVTEKALSDIRPVRPGLVLLAEDVDINRELGMRMLGSLGHTVVLAVDGADAIRQFQASERPFDLVLMDVNMPGVDGLEATKAIRALGGHGAEVPIVALTASAFPEEIARCLQSGMDDHLTKPVTQDLLNTRLSRWLEPAETDEDARRKVALDAGLAAMAGRFVTRKRDALATLQPLSGAVEIDDAALLQARAAAHQLAGVAAMFGEPELGELAREVDEMSRDSNPALPNRLAALVSALERSLTS